MLAFDDDEDVEPSMGSVVSAFVFRNRSSSERAD